MTGSFRFWPEAAAVARQLLLPSRHRSETPDTFLLISFKKKTSDSTFFPPPLSHWSAFSRSYGPLVCVRYT